MLLLQLLLLLALSIISVRIAVETNVDIIPTLNIVGVHAAISFQSTTTTIARRRTENSLLSIPSPSSFLSSKRKAIPFLLLRVRGGGNSQDTATSTSNSTSSSSSSRSTSSSSSIAINFQDSTEHHHHQQQQEEQLEQKQYGRISDTEYRLTPEQINDFFNKGCIIVEDVLTESEIQEIEIVFDQFMNRTIYVPDKDFCDMSKPFGIPFDEWSIVNCMLPTKYYPPLQNNIYEQLTNSIAQQLFEHKQQQQQQQKQKDGKYYMVKDYDQLLNKRPGKSDAIFAMHQDMAYWPGPKTLGVNNTDTCTFSLAIDDSTIENGCLQYIPYSGKDKQLWKHKPLYQSNNNNNDTSTDKNIRDEGHALIIELNDNDLKNTCHAEVKRGSITIHDEYVVHGSSGNTCTNKQRRTYVLAYRANEIVQAERALGFTHSHNDQINWDTFLQEQQQEQQQQQQKEEEENKTTIKTK